MIIHMIRDNLTLWAKSETDDEASTDDDRCTAALPLVKACSLIASLSRIPPTKPVVTM